MVGASVGIAVDCSANAKLEDQMPARMTTRRVRVMLSLRGRVRKCAGAVRVGALGRGLGGEGSAGVGNLPVSADGEASVLLPAEERRGVRSDAMAAWVGGGREGV
jgi:hypothetical protein